MLLLTGCGGYKAGTIRGDVYRNAKAGFRFETPEVFTVTEEADYQAWHIYQEAVRQAEERNALEGFNCEYAACASACELLICSEPNTHEDTPTAFLARICNHLRDEASGFEIRDLREVTYGGVDFKSATLMAHAHSLMEEHHHTHDPEEAAETIGYSDQITVCVTEAEDSIVYLLMQVHDREEAKQQKQAVLDSIHQK